MVIGLRVVFFGTPAFAVPTLERLLESSHTVVGVVSQPDRPRGRGHRLVPTPTKVVAASRDVPILQPERIRDEAFLEQVSALEPELGVVAAYGRILPSSLLAIPGLGLINVHASLLPAYRGAAPVQRAVMAGEPETGVTIMRIVQELDAGPMFDAVRRPIGPDETSVDVERGLADLGARLLVDVADRMAAGHASETPQDDSRATFAPKITKADAVIDWTRPAAQIHDQVRGLHPGPLPSVRITGFRHLLHRTRVESSTVPDPPGTIVEAAGDRLEIAAGDGHPVCVLEIQPEGRRVMSAREFLAGHRPEAGSRADPA